MEESIKISSNNSVASTIFLNSPLFINQCSKKFPNTITKHKIKSKNYDNEYSSILSLSKGEFSEFKDIKSIYQMEKNSQKFFKSDSLKHLSPEPNKLYIFKKQYSLFKNINNHSYLKKVCRNQTEKSNGYVRTKNSPKKKSMPNLAYDPGDKELNFYEKMKTLRGNNNNTATIKNNNQLLSSPNKKNYLDMISHNILQSRQTLNNPQEFYTDFFTNLVQKKINKGKKSKSKKDVSTKKNWDFNKNRIRSHRRSSDNNDEGKIKLMQGLQKGKQVAMK